jgi:hypothetical protein
MAVVVVGDFSSPEDVLTMIQQHLAGAFSEGAAAAAVAAAGSGPARQVPCVSRESWQHSSPR